MTTGTARVAGPADVDRIVEILTGAFFHDPLWGPAFPDVERRAEQAAGLWRFYVTCVQRYPCTFLTTGGEATAVWIPPGGVELTHDEEADLERLLLATTGRETTDGILEIMARFDAARPREPHYYLGLIGTHDAHRGRGHGMRLLAENLAVVDAQGAAAYLESSNPANDARYARHGFLPHATITAASGHVITTMWRPIRGIPSR
ncbi:GNAT family N-acetyltransferase [Actinoplanes sp. KI2]|uniref:GNAT family N-acetyltransferase n=1 Tax=Actinoplanes sp. KI2 TaxID=2983315 RepID=UPI0021D592A2|nr:GNAT family N-acetyltransferase [Actinoplanes sp. KI2]MCU7726240.1 GNAT family N-acetyltransferase [Actinoplanes sp. KI2]